MRYHSKTSIILLIALYWIFYSCKNKNDASVNSHIVRIDTVHTIQRDITIPLRASGKLSSKQELKLSFKTGGIIHQIKVKEGQSVKRGTRLAELNLIEIKARVRQAELAVEKTLRDYERAKNLYNDSVATLEQFQNAGTAMDLAKSNLQIARFNLKYSTIDAPSDGKILRILVEENEIIGAGHPVFLFASTYQNWVIRTNLTDRQTISVTLNDSAVIIFDAYPDEKFKAELTEISNSADPYTGTYEVELTLLQNPKKLVSGLIGKINIYPSIKERLYIVPIDALIEGIERTGYVYQLVDNRPVRKKILIHSIQQDLLYVTKGLQKGVPLITTGKNYIEPDSQLEIINSQKVPLDSVH